MSCFSSDQDAEMERATEPFFIESFTMNAASPILFDLDGTLLDTHDMILESMQQYHQRG